MIKHRRIAILVLGGVLIACAQTVTLNPRRTTRLPDVGCR